MVSVVCRSGDNIFDIVQEVHASVVVVDMEIEVLVVSIP